MTLAIIIPTKNRCEFLIRQLAYYTEIGCNHTIIIGDLSDTHHLESIHRAVSKLESQTDVKYFPLSGLTEAEAIQELSQRVDQSYVVLASEDDFLVPGALQDCAEFLDSHSDFSSACGISLSFAVGLDQAWGEFLRTGSLFQGTVEDANGRLRLIKFLSSDWPSHLCVQRTDNFKDAVAMASKSENVDFRQLLAGCVPMIRGKSKLIGRLYSCRQAHIQFTPTTHGFDWITQPDWFASYSIFCSSLTDELMRQDDVGLDEAGEVFKEGFRSYIAQRIAGGRSASLRSINAPPKKRWRKAGGALPGVRSAWQLGRRFGQAIRSMNPPPPDKLSLSELLTPSSPYHADFMPIYRAVTSPTE